MIRFFRSWCENLILSSFIVSIIEMLVPEGNIKKYIRVVTGIYMIFVILEPILLNFNKIDLEKKISNILEVSSSQYIEEKELENSYEILNKISNNLGIKEEEDVREVQK
ncbi:MAG: stage III sporulation protein AF [Clostridia bacterium]|nr:stage III sporulation protein AF [Clostridia bacterium]